MGDGVALHAAAVSHGSLTVSINETSNVSQPNAFAGGRTAVTPQSNIAVNHARGRGEFAGVEQPENAGQCAEQFRRNAGRHYVDFTGAA